MMTGTLVAVSFNDALFVYYDSVQMRKKRDCDKVTACPKVTHEEFSNRSTRTPLQA
jgi:hypothetical protein